MIEHVESTAKHRNVGLWGKARNEGQSQEQAQERGTKPGKDQEKTRKKPRKKPEPGAAGATVPMATARGRKGSELWAGKMGWSPGNPFILAFCVLWSSLTCWSLSLGFKYFR